MISEESRKDGKLHGISTIYYGDGNVNRIEQKRCYKNGKQHGPTIGFHNDGKMVFKHHYTEGEKSGIWLGWLNGNLAYEKEFKNGKPHGVFKFWYQDGGLDKTYRYKNGLRYGLAEV